MSVNSSLNPQRILAEKRYPLPRTVYDLNENANENASNRKIKIGIGVSPKTGRIQWCPGLTCCKLFLIITVIMVPITMLLMFFLRMDGLINALQTKNPMPNNFWTSMGFWNDTAQVHDSEYPPAQTYLYPANMAEQCLEKHRWNEWVDYDERHILKDAKTSFLPLDVQVMPHGCPEKIRYNSLNYLPTIRKLSPNLNPNQRQRRNLIAPGDLSKEIFIQHSNPVEKTSADEKSNESEVLTDNRNEFTAQDENLESSQRKEDDSHIGKNIASLESYWNEQGTRSSIRKAQAKTMMQYMDKKVNPCNDFYKFACGNWEKLHPIPRDKAGFDTFEMLRESLDVVLKQLLETPTYFFPQKKSELELPPPNQLAKLKSNEEIAEVQPAVQTAQETDSPRSHDTFFQAEDISEVVEGDKENTKDKESEESPDDLKEKLSLLESYGQNPEMLDMILNRQNRQTTNTKRKRLFHIFNSKAENATSADAKTQNLSELEYSAIEDAQTKAKHLYQSCINTSILVKRGIEPLKKLIADLGGWPVLTPHWKSENFDWLNLTATLRRYNNDILIVQWVGPDIKNSDENIIQFDQTSLGLPTREYFLQESNAKYLLAYKRFMSDIMQKLGAGKSKAQKTANELINFETRLAGITAPAEMRLNVTKLYKRMALRDLGILIPEINWLRYLSILQDRRLHDDEEVVIFAIDYMKDLVGLIATTPPEVLSNYLIWRFVRHRINNVDDRFDDTKQHFYHALFGREESPSRWKVCVAQVNTNMGMAVGSMFVSRYFDENSKRDTLQMTHEIQNSFRDILKSTEWIDDRTKILAEEKVNAMSLKIGYPNFILDAAELNSKYHDLHIHPERYFENTLNVLLHAARTEQNRLSEKVNKTHWQTAPAIVNAYYSRNKNQIMFPAGILQPPFYHRHFPRALNFGGIGVVIGHELTHGFDDKGRLFDSDGNIHKWWTDFSIRGFDSRARCIISQYSNYTVPEVGITLNGESTQGENIADNGGLRQAFYAYSTWLRQNPQEQRDEYLPGINMTGPQLFFLNFGQVWCGAMRPEAIRNKLNTAIHSPGRFRVIGTLSNSYDFARVFNCPPGSPMNPTRKCTVW